MKRPSKAPPEAIPFQRGRRASQPASARPAPAVRPVALDWIAPPVWSALAAEGTDAHRLASGPDLWLERFGDDVLVSY